MALEHLLRSIASSSYLSHSRSELLLLTDSGHDRNDSEANYSMDIITKNCFNDYDTIACARGAFIGVLNVMTIVLCLGRILTLHFYGSNSVVYCNHVAFFCLATVQCMFGTFEWIFGWKLELALSCECLRIVQLFLLCYTYTTLAFRLLRSIESFGARLAAACLTLCAVYFVFFVFLAINFHDIPWFDCYANYWLFLSAGQLFLVQIIYISSLLVLSRINSITPNVAVQRFRRRSLLLMVVAFEISALFGFCCHLMLRLTASDLTGCSGVFKHKQLVYTPFRVLYEVVVLLLPIWTLLYCFKPVRQLDSDQDHLFDSSDSSQSDAVNHNSPAVSNRRHMRRSRSADNQLFYGEENNGYVSDEVYTSNPTLWRHPRRQRNPPVHCRIPRSTRKWKRCKSAPFLKSNATPTLYTIPEESNQSSSGHSSPRSTPSGLFYGAAGPMQEADAIQASSFRSV